MPRFNHAFDIAFEVESDHSAKGDDVVPAAELRKGLQQRLDSMSDREIVEACGAPFDSTDEGAEMPEENEEEGG